MTKRAPVVWDRHAIRAEVHRRETTLRAIALAAGLHFTACSSALIRRHLAGEKALADFLGLPPEVIWPERYAKLSPWAKRILAKRESASQNVRPRSDMGAAA